MYRNNFIKINNFKDLLFINYCGHKNSVIIKIIRMSCCLALQYDTISHK